MVSPGVTGRPTWAVDEWSRGGSNPRPPDGFSGNFWEPPPLFGWRLTPGAIGWAKRCFGDHVEWQAYTRVNSLGRCDREIPYARTGAYRILVLGDSFPEGMQVDVKETFCKRLEGGLAGAGGRPAEVINGGTSGYGTDNELLFYRHEGRKFPLPQPPWRS